ncbi:MAG: hypothetical protein GXO43_02205 [Crenarchaeota archaeon]|nr:hypothetical protein [Thermoproteota archaeon]
MARLYVFDDSRSVFHFLYAVLVYLPSAKHPYVSLIGTLLFLLYEVPEKENPISTLGDLEEFIIGALIGLVFSVHTYMFL